MQKLSLKTEMWTLFTEAINGDEEARDMRK